MANEGDAILAALNGLASGFAKGIEHRQKSQLEERELSLKEQEVTLRHEERVEANKQSAIYRSALSQAALGGLGVSQMKASTEATNTITDNIRDAQTQRSRAQAEIDKSQKDRQTWVKKKAQFGANPDMLQQNPQVKAQYEAANENLSQIDANISELTKQRDEADQRAREFQARLPGKGRVTLPQQQTNQADNMLRAISAAGTYDEALKNADAYVFSPNGPKPGSPDFIRIQQALYQKKQSSIGASRRTPPTE